MGRNYVGGREGGRGRGRGKMRIMIGIITVKVMIVA